MSDEEYYESESDDDDVCEECYGQNCEEDEDKGYCDCEDCNCYEINSDDDDMSIKDIIDNLDVEADGNLRKSFC
jgi:hypothetical protein